MNIYIKLSMAAVFAALGLLIWCLFNQSSFRTLGYPGCMILFLVAKKLGDVGDRHNLKLADEVERTDARPPILFLRGFGVEDRIPNDGFIHRVMSSTGLETNEKDILHGLDRLGPVVGLWNPLQQRNPIGFAIKVTTSEDWPATVKHYISKSQLIIILFDDTGGVAWEVAEVLKAGRLSRTIFCMPRESRDRLLYLTQACVRMVLGDAATVRSMAAGYSAALVTEHRFPYEADLFARQVDEMLQNNGKNVPAVALLFDREIPVEVYASSSFGYMVNVLAKRVRKLDDHT